MRDGEARDDELGARLQLGDAPDDVELALEGVGVETAGRGDEELPDPRRRRRGDRAEAARIDGHVAPVDDGLALGGDDPLEELLEHRRADGILRQEAHPDAVRARLRQRAAELGAEQRVRQPQRHPGAVAGVGVGPRCAPVLEVRERAGGPHDGLVRGLPVQPRDEGHPA